MSINLLYLIVAIIIFMLINVAIFSTRVQEYLDRNWKDIRCYPYIIPIAGLSKRPEGSGFFGKTFSNFNFCMANFIKVFMSIFLEPFMGKGKKSGGIINGITKGVAYIKNIIDVFRRMATVLRELFAALVENTVERMKNSFGAIVYFQEKLKLLIKKQSAMFEILNQFASTLPFLLYSFSHGPIPRFANWLVTYVGVLIAIIIVCLLCIFGGPFTKLFLCPVCLVCFTPDTLIDIDDQTKIQIKDINIGDNIKDNVVLGKLYIKKRYAELYNYKGTLVTGNHLVFHDNMWKRVHDTECEKINMNTDLNCLITSNNTIHINGTKFRDYQETKDIDINLSINYKTSKNVNNKAGCITTSFDKYNNYYWGFSENTLVKLGEEYVKITTIVNNPDKFDVEGVVEIDMDVELYNYKGIIVSGNTLVYESGIWLRVFQSRLSKKLSSKNRIYNIITDSNEIIVKSNKEDILFKDFIEDSSEQLNNEIDKMVEKRLNLFYSFDI